MPGTNVAKTLPILYTYSKLNLKTMVLGHDRLLLNAIMLATSVIFLSLSKSDREQRQMYAKQYPIPVSGRSNHIYRIQLFVILRHSPVLRHNFEYIDTGYPSFRQKPSHIIRAWSKQSIICLLYTSRCV